MRRVFSKVLSASFVLIGSLTPSAYAADKPNQVDLITANVVGIRESASEYVLIAKESLKVGSPEYLKAREDYAAAKTANVKWLTFVTSAVRGGRASNLDADANYKKLADDAELQEKTFIEHVHDATRPKELALLDLIGSLAESGVKIWIQFMDRNAANRDKAATTFESMTKWDSWEGITGPAPKPVHPEAAGAGDTK